MEFGDGFGEVLLPKEEKIVTLPDSETMLERLVEAGGDLGDLRKGFYPLFLKKSGRKMTAEGIVMTLVSVFDEYAEECAKRQSRPPIQASSARAKEFIRALTPGAKSNERIADVRKRAEELWEETLRTES